MKLIPPKPIATSTPASSGDTWNEIVYADRAFPNPVIVASTTGATLSAIAGTLLVNKGLAHTVGRTAGIIPPAYQTIIAAPLPLLAGGNLTFRCAMKTATTGTVTIQLDSATPLNATGNGTVWTSDNAALVVRVDEDWSWFEVDIPQRNDAGTNIKVTMPMGLIQLPCLYYPPVATSLPPKVVTGMKLIDPKSGRSIIFKPSEFTKPADLVPVRSRLGMMPDPNWITTPSAMPSWYIRSYSGALTSLSFEYQDRDNPAIGTFTLTDFVAGFTARDSIQSAYFGHPSRFFDVTPSGGVPMRIAVGLNPTDAVILYVMRPTGAGVPGKLRKVMINGEFVDWIPVGDRIDTTNAAQDALVAANATAIANNTALVNRLSRRTVTVANAGIAVPVGDRIQCRIAPSGNQSLQFSAVSGSVTWNAWASHSIENGLTPAAIASHAMTTTWEYAMSGLTFTRQSDSQVVYLQDTTNGRNWKVTVIIGGSFNNNHFVVEEFI